MEPYIRAKLHVTFDEAPLCCTVIQVTKHWDIDWVIVEFEKPNRHAAYIRLDCIEMIEMLPLNDKPHRNGTLTVIK
jgi:hypothetical protein